MDQKELLDAKATENDHQLNNELSEHTSPCTPISMKAKSDCTKAALITNEFANADLNALVSPELQYAYGLRTLILRILLKTSASDAITVRGGRMIGRITDFLGFGNFEQFVADRSKNAITKDLEAILTRWQKTQEPNDWIPSELNANLTKLAKVVGLNPTEKNLLGFSVLLHAEPILESAIDLLGSGLAGFLIHRQLSGIFRIDEKCIQDALRRDGKLFQSGLITVDMRGRANLKQLLDLMTPAFHARMLEEQSDIRNLVAGFVQLASPTTLSSAQFTYASEFVTLAADYLKERLAKGKTGTNILIYGAPGTGKSQLARVLAKELQVNLLEVSATDLAGAAVAPIRRVRNYSVAQSFYTHGGNVILFDEVEEVFAQVGVNRSNDEAVIPQKSFLNALLDSSKIPTIWIANSIGKFDQAYLRRFAICFEMPALARSTRSEMLQDAFQDSIGKGLIEAIAQNAMVSPALIQQVAEVCESFPINEPIVKREERVVLLFNQQLRAQGSKQLQYSSSHETTRLTFDPKVINCAEDVCQIAEGLKDAAIGRICLYGPPGTGKTAYGKWIAQTLKLPHLVVSGSDLRSPYVGMTEKNIARAFAKAKAERAVLQLDEVDTFLMDRTNNNRTHEVAHINEMLVQMENYQGIFIASTNLMDNLDDAALRRFDMALKFDFLRPEHAVSLYHQAANLLGLDATDPALLCRVEHLNGLTPGDFDQLLRRARITRIQNSERLVCALEQASALKKGVTQSKPMGFLKVA